MDSLSEMCYLSHKAIANPRMTETDVVCQHQREAFALCYANLRKTLKVLSWAGGG